MIDLDLEAIAEAPFKSKNVEKKQHIPNSPQQPEKSSSKNSLNGKCPNSDIPTVNYSFSNGGEGFHRHVDVENSQYHSRSDRSSKEKESGGRRDLSANRSEYDRREHRIVYEKENDSEIRYKKNEDYRKRRYEDRYDESRAYSERERERDRYYDYEYRRRHGGRSYHRKRSRSRSQERRSRPREADVKRPRHRLSEEERDARTIFVQQLAARLRTRELYEFFEKAGPVREAQIVKDRITGKSKGVGYVEFVDEESVSIALEMTGSKLLGIPIIVQLTEAEKNRQARQSALESSSQSEPKFYRIQIGNVHFSIGEDELRQIFEPFGEIDVVHLNRDSETKRSRGNGYIQFRDTESAKDAYSKMNGFDLAGRPLRITLGSDRNGQYIGSEKVQGNLQISLEEKGQYDSTSPNQSSAQSGTYITRELLMEKLARNHLPEAKSTILSSRCVLLRNLYDPAEETGENWVTELEEDVRDECENKYGKTVFLKVDENSEGELYVKFVTEDGAKRAVEGLNGRWFGGRTIKASFCADSLFYAKCPKAKNL